MCGREKVARLHRDLRCRCFVSDLAGFTSQGQPGHTIFRISPSDGAVFNPGFSGWQPENSGIIHRRALESAPRWGYKPLIMGEIEIREIAAGSDPREFIDASHAVFKGDSNFIAPLEMFDIKPRLDPKKNPFFKRGEAVYFVARRGGELVGRISASIDHEHNRVWKEKTGFYGFFDTIDDDAVGAVLLDRAAAWLKARGMERMSGPYGLYANEEIGTLIEGFETPPVLMMAHSRPWQGRVTEACGLVKEKDLLAWRYEVGEFPRRAEKAWADMMAMPELKLRSVNTSKMHDELKIIMDIYNDAWDGKWGFVPALPDEIEKTAEDLKLIIDSDLAYIAEIDGKPMGMCILLPNMNECIRDIGGKEFPFGIVKALWRLKVSGPKSARLMLLGIRKELRGVRKYMPLSAAMYVEVAKRASAKGYTWGELSWTREDDSPINSGITSMGAKIYKRYRVYTKNI